MERQAVMKSAGGAAIQQLDLLCRAGSVSGLSDVELLSRAVLRDREVASIAFEALVRRHGPMVLATCRGVLRHEHDAEDAFQATFLVLARRAGSLRSGDRLGPWLHRVALRASERARVAAVRRRDREAELAAMVQPRPVWDAEREELRHMIHQEVNRLPERYRVVVVLCDLQGESYETSASRLRVPVGTIRSRLSRAREQLRARIARRGLALPAGVVAATLASRETSAALPAHLLASTVKMATLGTTVKLATLGTTVGLSGGGVSAPSAATTYAEGVLKSGGLLVPGKAGLAIAVAGVGIGLAGAGLGVFTPRNPPARPMEVGSAPLPAIDPRIEARRDPELLQGRWVIVEAEQHGQPLSLVVGDRLVIEADRFGWTAERGEPQRIFRRGTTRGKIAIGSDADTRHLDLIEPGRAISAIYRPEGDGDRLRLCVGDPDRPGRPRSFSSEPRSRQLLLVLRRDQAGGRRGVSPTSDDVNQGENQP